MGYAGNDNLSGGYCDDTLDGGADSNIDVYRGYQSSYSVAKSGAIYTVSSSVEGTDTLNQHCLFAIC